MRWWVFEKPSTQPSIDDKTRARGPFIVRRQLVPPPAAMHAPAASRQPQDVTPSPGQSPQRSRHGERRVRVSRLLCLSGVGVAVVMVLVVALGPYGAHELRDVLDRNHVKLARSSFMSVSETLASALESNVAPFLSTVGSQAQLVSQFPQGVESLQSFQRMTSSLVSPIRPTATAPLLVVGWLPIVRTQDERDFLENATRLVDPTSIGIRVVRVDAVAGLSWCGVRGLVCARALYCCHGIGVCGLHTLHVPLFLNDGPPSRTTLVRRSVATAP